MRCPSANLQRILTLRGIERIVGYHLLDPAKLDRPLENPLEIVCGLFGAGTPAERPRHPKNRNAPRAPGAVAVIAVRGIGLATEIATAATPPRCTRPAQTAQARRSDRPAHAAG